MSARAHPNDRIRAVRVERFQMSRSEFATAINEEGARLREYVTCSTRTIATWEDGEVVRPRPVYCRVLSSLTGMTAEELGFAPPRRRTRPAPANTDRMARRDFLLESTAGVGLSLVPHRQGRTVGRLGEREVHSMRALVQQLYSYDHNHGSAALRREATEALRAAYTWLHEGSYHEQTGKRLRSAAGHLSIATGWLSYDSGKREDARSLYGEALAAGRMVRDPWLEAHAFGCLSMLAKADKQPWEAVTAAQCARSVAQDLGSSRMLALFSLREAAGWALMGDRSACDKALVRAYNDYAKGPCDEDPAWLEFFTPAELAGLESLCRADLGQHDRAAAGAEQAVMLYGDGFARNRALYIADVAIHHAARERPELDQATDAARRLLGFLPAVGSARLVQALHDVADVLGRYAPVPVVSDWLEDYRTTIDTPPGGPR